MANRYWVGGTDTWNNNKGSKWATTSGGAGGASVPGAADAVFFDANSGSGTITIGNPSKSIQSWNMTGFTGTIAGSTDVNVGGGNVTFGSGMTNSWTGGLTMSGSAASRTLTTNGKTLGGLLTFDGSGSTFSTAGTLTTTNQIRLNQGTFDANNQNINATSFTTALGSGTRTVNMGTGTWTLTGGTNRWDATGATVNASTSTLILSGTISADRQFVGNSQTYYNVQNATTGAFSITVTGSNTFNNLTINAGRTMLFTAGTTNTFANFTAIGTSGNVITIGSDTLAQHTLVKSGGGTVDVEYCSISYSNASPSDTWYAYLTDNNTNGGNNTGWIFSDVTFSPAIMTFIKRAGGLM